MMEETKSYRDDFHEFTRVFGCLTEIQANIKKIRNNRETQQETCQVVVQEEQLEFEEENTPNKSSPETIMQDVEEYVLIEVEKVEHCGQPLEIDG